MMIDIASALSYTEFDEIKDCELASTMWNEIKEIYGGDKKVILVEKNSQYAYLY